LGSCSLERCLRRVPFSSPQWLAPPLAGPRLPPPDPVPSSGFLPLSTVLAVLAATRGTLASPTVLPWHPDASRPSFMPLASLESPFRAFPSRGAVPALAGLLLPCGFAFDSPPPRLRPRTSRPLSPPSRPLAQPLLLKGTRRLEPRRRFPATASRPCPRRLRAPPRSTPRTHRCSVVSDRHARFEALLPSGVRSRDDSHSGQR